MDLVVHQFVLSAPLFLLVLAGWAVMKVFRLPLVVAKIVHQVVFLGALPLLLFHLMSHFSEMPPADGRVLLAFFGGCLVVFALGRFVGPRVLGLTGVESSVLGVGGIFSNNVMLGVPLATLVLGTGSLPTVSLVLVFNALLLWTLVTVAVEWARHGSPDLRGLAKTLIHIFGNPLLWGIGLGLAGNFAGVKLPNLVETGLDGVSSLAGPLALFSLGMGLAPYRLGQEKRVTAALVALKLLVHPLVVWVLAALLSLPSSETKAVVLLSSLAIGANVALMSRQFQALEVPVGQALLLSTVVSAVTTPLFLAVVP